MCACVLMIAEQAGKEEKGGGGGRYDRPKHGTPFQHLVV